MKAIPRFIIVMTIVLASVMTVAVAAKTSAPVVLRNTPLPQASATVTIAPSATIDTSQPTVIYPTIEPEPTTGFAGDKFTRFSIDKSITDGIGRLWVSFVNINDKPA